MHATEVKISTYNKEYAPRCTITASDFRQMVIKNVGIQVDCCVGQSRSEMHVDELNLMQKSFVIKHIAWHFDNTNLDLSVIVNRLQLRSNDFEQHFSFFFEFWSSINKSVKKGGKWEWEWRFTIQWKQFTTTNLLLTLLRARYVNFHKTWCWLLGALDCISSQRFKDGLIRYRSHCVLRIYSIRWSFLIWK